MANPICEKILISLLRFLYIQSTIKILRLTKKTARGKNRIKDNPNVRVNTQGLYNNHYKYIKEQRGKEIKWMER